MATANMLFHPGSPTGTWIETWPMDYPRLVCGVIHSESQHRATCGMPLGGIDTGCIDLDSTGFWGYSTIFNSHVPRGGNLNTPAFGLSVDGHTWVLSSLRMKSLRVGPSMDDRKSELENPDYLEIPGVSKAKDIHYMARYPVADMQFSTTAPVAVGVRAWSPFIPGDVAASMVPAAMFDVHLQNKSGIPQKGTFAFNFPGPNTMEVENGPHIQNELTGTLNGHEMGTEAAQYVLAAINEPVRKGASLATYSNDWASIHHTLPELKPDSLGTSLAYDFDLLPGQKKVVRFVLSWRSPMWYAGGCASSTADTYAFVWTWQNIVPNATNRFMHRYATSFATAKAAAEFMLTHRESLFKRITAWQSAIYAEEKLPVWLRDSLVNVLHLITEDSHWAVKQAPLPVWVKAEDGLFGMNECPRDCPQIECMPCSWYGNIPLYYFFPQAVLSTLRGYKGYQYDDGCPPWIFGGGTAMTPFIEMSMPTRGYQIAQNVCEYVDMVNRYWLTSQDKRVLEEFYPSIKKTMEFTLALNTKVDGFISMPDRKVSVCGPAHTETLTFEFCAWYGMAAMLGGIRIAMADMVEKMAETLGDAEYAAKCRQIGAEARKSMEEKLWTGTHYLHFWEEATGKKVDGVFGYQLDGQWVADFHGQKPVLNQDRMDKTLEIIKRLNVAKTRFGAVNFVNADGTFPTQEQAYLKGSYQPYDFFPPEVLILAMTYMYRGQKEFGLELAQRCWGHIVLKEGLTWEMPNIINGEHGTIKFGADYYQDMLLWALPAALEGKDISGPMQDGGLVARVLKAGRAAADETR